MALKEILPGTRFEDLSKKIYFVMKGSFKGTFPGGSFVIKNQEIIGLLNLNLDDSPIVYEALEKSQVIEYDYTEYSISEFIDNHNDIRKFIVRSIFKQVNTIISQYKLLYNEYESIKSYIDGTYDDYVYHCEKTGISPTEIASYDELMGYEFEEALPSWMVNYYISLEDIIASSDVNNMDSDFLTGILCKSTNDISLILNTCSEVIDNKNDILTLLINENENDILEIYLNLYLKAVKKFGLDNDITGSIYREINDIIMQSSAQDMDSNPFFKDRINTANDTFKKAAEIGKDRKELSDAVGAELYEKVTDSLGQILSYAKVDSGLSDSFKEHIETYKKTINKNGPSDDLRRLRLDITNEFNSIYINTFVESVDDNMIPPIVKMFLNFGYVDEDIAGIENAVYMYKIVNNLPTDPERGVYSYYEWLLSIYDNIKDPSRNEFDVDYAEYLHEMQRNHQITKEQEKALFSNRLKRVEYELNNVFPSVNKTTTGRITTFCPVFSEHNILKDLGPMLVKADDIENSINAITKIDFGAYFRQTVYTNPEIGIQKEFIDIEVRPDVILTPNIGNRGILWQEIEGKRRTTPARMFISIFQQEDINMLLLKLTGQFRWEMCKRIQGARWNDITDKSLTSEYSDYIQYYRKNKDLSPEVKEKIKNELVRAKNSFREMFIRDYVSWIQYESTGSPRMNKVVRRILFEYIPFSASVRGRLCINPMYKEMMERYQIKQKAKIHRLDGLIRKIENSANDVPEEILEQRKYYDK